MSQVEKKFNTLTENINYILQYYADIQNTLYIVEYHNFWDNIDINDIKSLILYYADKINALINKTQDFSQYSHNHMPIRLKFALMNIRTIIIELNLTDHIFVTNIKFKLDSENNKNI